MYSIQEILEVGQQKADNRDRVIPELKQGQHIAQGDLSFIYLPQVPCQAVLVKKPDLQLAPGNTKGSRHCLDSLKNVEVFRLPDANELQGVILRFRGKTTVTHPEHGNLIFNQGVFLVKYQRQFANELRRIAD